MVTDTEAPAARLRFHVDAEGVAEITFDHPPTHNSLDEDGMIAFAACVAALAERASSADAGGLRAVLVRGAGAVAFCSGGDQVALASAPTIADGRRVAAHMGDALAQLEALPIPVVAAVNGYALGGGAEISLACDLMVVDDAVRWGLVHLRMGLTPGWGAGQRLLRRVGYGRAMGLLLDARPLGARELRALGLADHVAEAGGAAEAARTRIARFLRADAAAVRDVKALLRTGVLTPPAEAMAAERALFPARWASDAHADAMRRFAEGDRAGRPAPDEPRRAL